MKTGDIVKQFGISESTVRRWVKEYEPFFSEAGNSRQRTFTSEDFLVIATIIELAKEGFPTLHINKRLEEGYRVESATAQTMGYTDGRMVPAAAVEQIIDATELRIELEQIKAERDKLLEILERERDEHRDREDALRTDLKSIQEQIALLQRELGRAEGELSYRREMEKRPKDE